MKQAITVIMGNKKLILDVLNDGVADEIWRKFIQNYCKNISAIETPKEVSLIIVLILFLGFISLVERR